jgi:ABC-type bacteriocin/lantibiotic exporter with double-glycine peptidase domain
MLARRVALPGPETRKKSEGGTPDPGRYNRSTMLALALAAALAVPFVPQAKDTCGAAALAMVLGYWEQPGSHDEIASALKKKELHGIAGSELEAFARARGLQALAYKGDAGQLRDFLGKGRPLIVAWKMGRDRYHNVVVTGFDPERLEFVVNDPARGAGRRVSARAFEKRWAGAGHWTLLVIPPAP